MGTELLLIIPQRGDGGQNNYSITPWSIDTSGPVILGADKLTVVIMRFHDMAHVIVCHTTLQPCQPIGDKKNHLH